MAAHAGVWPVHHTHTQTDTEKEKKLSPPYLIIIILIHHERLHFLLLLLLFFKRTIGVFMTLFREPSFSSIMAETIEKRR